ncbi:hypothetical protein [Aromatoleum diolicum]|uniref:Porin n=1 Tax=Aromatoleum diolicum TaxID=75796 RepID=A0ABX1Q8G3_9RHOO|nr:hypothetical protein [Aromatoleum diolicum]NMG73835.1 hypothetical protein [Aromatoleum diolicum]
MTARLRLRQPLRSAVAALALTFASASACAADDAAQPPRVEFSGFATLGAVSTDNKDVWFARWGVNFPGDSDPDFSADSLIGLQASLRLTAYNAITLQALAMEDGSERQDPRITLAFFRQTLAPGLSMRIGRLRVPFFMLSDSLYINYANPWVRPPVEVYGLNPFNDLDGIDFIYHTRIGELDAEIHPYYGRGEIPFPEGKARLDETWGLNVALTQGNLSLHLGRGDGRFTFERGDAQFRAIAAVLRAAGQGSVVTDLSGAKGKTSFYSIGVQWDDGLWQTIGEYARRDANRYVPSAYGWYLSLGRRFGSVTPYVSVARQTLHKQFAEATLPPGRLATAWETFLTSRNNAQRSVTLGTRWDVSRQAALKAELTHARPDRDSWGSYFPRETPTTMRIGGRALNTLSISVDVNF